MISIGKEGRLVVHDSQHIAGLVPIYSSNTRLKKFAMKFKCYKCDSVFYVPFEDFEVSFTSGYIKCLKN